MKKILTIMLVIFTLTACTRLDTLDYDDSVHKILLKENNKITMREEGFSYYVPFGFTIVKRDGNNIVFSYKNKKIYMYVDLYAYNIKAPVKYEENEKIHYSRKINNYDKEGYISIREEKGAYFYNILYNYFRVEGYSEKEDIKLLMTKIFRLLSSVKYNDKIIEKKLNKDNNTYSETELEYFRRKKSGGPTLGYEEQRDESYKNIKGKDEYLY